MVKIMEELKSNYDLMKIFEDKTFVKVCAPMVRYSKLQFRTLVREYGCDLCFTPMILADSFCQSQKARDNEFSTNSSDTPLVVQFAANTVHDFVGASYMVSPYSDGVDLNCGCPQRWARCQGIGCVLLERPDLISDLIRQCRNHITKPFTISVKTRILSDIKKTISICQQLEHAGVSFMTIHARTPGQHSTGPVNLEALKLISQAVQCPVIANGGVKSFSDIAAYEEETLCQGIMVATSLLTNPALYTGAEVTPIESVKRWLDICYNSTMPDLQQEFKEMPERSKNLTYQCFHHHLVFMLEKILPRQLKTTFNNLKSFSAVIEFLRDHLQVSPDIFSSETFHKYKTVHLNYGNTNDKYIQLKKLHHLLNNEIIESYDCNQSDGKFFKSKMNELDDCDTCITNLFL